MTGQDFIDLLYSELGGYSNAVSPQDMLNALNEGKDEIWGYLKELNDQYFLVQTQPDQGTEANFFPNLTTDTREYDLPDNLREIKFIECLTSGYTLTKFTYKKVIDPVFRSARQEANEGMTTNQCTEFFYTVTGNDTFILANYVPTTLNVCIWYIRSIPDFENNDVDSLIEPFSKKIVEYAAKKIMLSVQDPTQFAVWQQQWRNSLESVNNQASSRNAANAIFVQGWDGASGWGCDGGVWD